VLNTCLIVETYLILGAIVNKLWKLQYLRLSYIPRDATPNLKTAIETLVTQPDADIRDIVGTVAPFTASPGAPAAIAGTAGAAPIQLRIGSTEDSKSTQCRYL